MENDEIRNSTDEVLEINKAKRDFKIELALFFILGLLLGVTVKTEAAKRITIGFNDYKIDAAADSYNVSEIKKKLVEEAKNNPSGAQDPSLQGAGACH
ncbi:MAG TPA: hypothetical protein DCX32_02490 [Candidatus Moranbacteria bacterium]|nr:MAG: hypothetical protein UW87_C0029G0008 [Candidatus Moranbacteria bacterium GW2011_GWC2_45_10]KKT94599.1 MAG: hypothetical protein UW95_C0012G0015 [Parcubacteria group bacterium GW2011_GWC1_45_14]HAV11388.1 hypothetical protein [Candidatus Moranbacteria bacterium]